MVLERLSTVATRGPRLTLEQTSDSHQTQKGCYDGWYNSWYSVLISNFALPKLFLPG